VTTRRTARSQVATLVAAVALLAGGCTGGDEEPQAARSSAASSPPASDPQPTPQSTPSPEPARPPAPPPDEACYRLGLVQATRPSNASRPVSCRGPHTAQTIHVGRLDLSPNGRRLGVDSAAVQRQPARVCPVQLRRYVGGTTDVRRRSRLEVVWFLPTAAQADRGARWFRCDAVAVASEDRLLRLALGGRLRNVLDRPRAPAAYGLCGTARPGTRGFERVACALPHSWEAVSTIDLAGGVRYPGTARVRTAGDKACADEVQQLSGQVLELSYGWEWPTRDQWAAGQHYGYCWAPSRPS
jgi:hypothetical protein